MVAQVDKDIVKIRPSLFAVDPKTYLISWAFAVFNLIMCIFLFNTPGETLRVPTITGLVNTALWGGVFLGLSITLTIGLLFNKWAVIRGSMIAGLFIKAFWAYALVVVAIQQGWIRILASLGMWAVIAAVQAIVVIYFMPKDVVKIKVKVKPSGKSIR